MEGIEDRLKVRISTHGENELSMLGFVRFALNPCGLSEIESV
jgi:hypothetical protein